MRSLDVRAVGPNHSDLMGSIQPDFREYVEGLKLNESDSLITLNTSALPTNSTALIREELVAHLSRTVQWEQSVRNMILMGVDTFIEWGSDTLSKFIRRIDPRVRTISIIDKQQVEMLIL